MPDLRAPARFETAPVRLEAPERLYHEPHWYACLTRPRSEKKVSGMVEEMGYEQYLPLVEQEREWSDRTKRVLMPLFPGYLFVRFTLARMRELLEHPFLVSVARPNGHPTPVRSEELDSVRRMVEGAKETGILPRPEDYLEPGDPVVVMSGPFEGMTGVLIERKGRFRLAVRIPALRQATSVDVERSAVRPARRGELARAT